MKRVPAIDRLFGALAAAGYKGGTLPWQSVMVVWAGVSVTESAIARALNDEQVWPRGLREQAIRWLADPEANQHAYPQGTYSVLPAQLLSKAEGLATKEGASVLQERHVVQAIETDARAMQILGVDLALFVSRTSELEALEHSGRFANLRNRLRQLQANLSPTREHEAAYLADLDSFRRAAVHALNQAFGQGNDLAQAFGDARRLGSIGTFENLVSGELIRYERILADAEERYVEGASEPQRASEAPAELLTDLRRVISSAPTRELTSFLSEAVRCLEVQAFRATAIMAWAGAISILHDAAARHGLKELEQAARLVNPKAHHLSKRDDLQYYDDELLLKALEKAGLLNRTELGLLLHQLKRRNAYAHPSGVEPSVEEVRALLSELVQIVFTRFSVNQS
jgi:hypothetical protein